jgi:hypothetical protein
VDSGEIEPVCSSRGAALLRFVAFCQFLEMGNCVVVHLVIVLVVLDAYRPVCGYSKFIKLSFR